MLPHPFLFSKTNLQKTNQLSKHSQPLISPKNLVRNPVKRNSFSLNSNINSNQNRFEAPSNDYIQQIESKIDNIKLKRFFKKWKLSTSFRSSKDSYISDDIKEYINKFRDQDDFNYKNSNLNTFEENYIHNDSNYDMNYDEYIKEYGDIEEIEDDETSNLYDNDDKSEEIFFASDGSPLNESNYFDYPNESYFENHKDFAINHNKIDMELSQPYNDDFFHRENSSLDIQIPNINTYYNAPPKTLSVDTSSEKLTPLNAYSFINTLSPVLPPSTPQIRPNLSSSQVFPCRTNSRRNSDDNILLESLEKEILPMYQKYLPM